MGIQMAWNDARKVLSLHLAPGSRMLPPGPMTILVKLAELKRSVTFEGKPVEVSFDSEAAESKPRAPGQKTAARF